MATTETSRSVTEFATPIRIAWDSAHRERFQEMLRDLEMDADEIQFDVAAARRTLDRLYCELVIETPHEAQMVRLALQKFMAECLAETSGSALRALVRVRDDLDEEMAERGFEAVVDDEFALMPEFECYRGTHRYASSPDACYDYEYVEAELPPVSEGTRVRVTYRNSNAERRVTRIGEVVAVHPNGFSVDHQSGPDRHVTEVRVRIDDGEKRVPVRTIERDVASRYERNTSMLNPDHRDPADVSVEIADSDTEANTDTATQPKAE